MPYTTCFLARLYSVLSTFVFCNLSIFFIQEKRTKKQNLGIAF